MSESSAPNSDAPLAVVPVPRVYLAGTGSGVGVTTVTLGLGVALRRKKMSIGIAQLGADLVQTTHYRRLSSQLSHSLHLWMLTPEQQLEMIARQSVGAEAVLIEGTRGLIDHYPPDSPVLTEVQTARSLSAPVILVVDAKRFKEGIAALIRGFDESVESGIIAGIICNFVQNEAHEKILRDTITALNGPKYLGSVRESPLLTNSLTVEEKKELALNPSMLSRNYMVQAGQLVEAGVNLEALQQIFAKCKPIRVRKSVVTNRSRAVKVAVADDMAFHLTMQSNLDLLRREGAELMPFSPLVDRKLPKQVKAIYLPGGYAHLYAQELSANEQMHSELRAFVDGGGVVYAEGTAIGYVCKTAHLASGVKLEMTGLMPAHANLVVEVPPLPDPSCIEVRLLGKSIIGRGGERIRGFRDNRWALRLETQVPTAFEIHPRPFWRIPDDTVLIPEGFQPTERMLVTSAHLHWGSKPGAARAFLDAVGVA